MSTLVRSFAKINIGLRIGPLRPDGFHQLRTVYQTLAIHDLIRIHVGRGSGIEIVCRDSRVPAGPGNTCWRVTDLVLSAMKIRAKVRIEIEKNLPVQGGMGAASSNGVATMLALEKALKRQLPPKDRLRIAAEVGSDLPLFLIGGTVLGASRGEEVYAIEDLPRFHCVAATPPVGVSTPAAFAEWDKRNLETNHGKLTVSGGSDTIKEFSQAIYGWMNGSRFTPTGVPAKSRDRAEPLLLDLVRTGIANDFEAVIFPKYPAIEEIKGVLERKGAKYASLSGSGATVYGLFKNGKTASITAKSLIRAGIAAYATSTLPRSEYWRRLFAPPNLWKSGLRKG